MKPLSEQIKICKYGHECTSGCQKDFDCPCVADHCCDMSDCEGCDECAQRVEALEAKEK